MDLTIVSSGFDKVLWIKVLWRTMITCTCVIHIGREVTLHYKSSLIDHAVMSPALCPLARWICQPLFLVTLYLDRYARKKSVDPDMLDRGSLDMFQFWLP